MNIIVIVSTSNIKSLTYLFFSKLSLASSICSGPHVPLDPYSVIFTLASVSAACLSPVYTTTS